MNISEHYRVASELLSKYKQYDYTIEIFNDSAKRAQMDAIAYRLGRVGTPNGVFRTSSDSIMQDLAPLQKVQDTEIQSTGSSSTPLGSIAGFAEFPADCYQITSAYLPYNSTYERLVKTRNLAPVANFEAIADDVKAIDIKILEQDQFINRCSSAIAPPTVRYPIAAYVSLNLDGVQKSGIQIAPVSYVGQVVNIMYILDPPSPIYVADNDENNVNYTLPSSCDSELVWRVCRYIAVSFRDDGMIAYANALKPNNIIQ